MSTDLNADLVRTLIADFRRGDLAAVHGHFAPDAVWELPGQGTLAGRYKGPDEIVGFLARSYELSGGTLSIEPMAVMSGPQHAGHLQRVSARRETATLDCVEVLVHEIVDGRIVRTYHRPDQDALHSFFG